MWALAVLAIAQGGLQSEGPLEIKDLTAPQNAVLYEPVEISFGLNGTWNNPFDPRQISVTATVVGSRNLFSTVYGYYDQPYRAISTEEGETLEEAGPPVWRIRYAPWNTGAYSVAIEVMDLHGKTTHPNLTVRTAGRPEEIRSTGGFVEIRPNQQYLRIADRSFFPIGVNVRDTEASDEALRMVAGSGANAIRLLITTDGWALNGKGKLGEFDLQTAWRLERFLNQARDLGVYVLLSLNDSRELQDGWPANPFNRANGGPVETPEDFWTNHSARIQYKRQLRYLVSRLSNNPAFMGIEFWRGIEAPDYWIMEMGNEVYDLHPFAVVITTEGVDDSLIRVERQRAMSMPLPENMQEAVGTIERVRKVAVKPVLAISPSSHNPWRKMIAGAAGIIVGGLSDLERVRELARFAQSIEWRDRSLDLRPVTGAEDRAGWALIDDRGGPMYMEAADQSGAAAGTASIAMRRGGIYRYQWLSTDTGEVLAEGEMRDVRGELSVPYPAFRGAIAGTLTRR